MRCYETLKDAEIRKVDKADQRRNFLPSREDSSLKSARIAKKMSFLTDAIKYKGSACKNASEVKEETYNLRETSL